MLPEDIQDHESPMVLIGCDVDALYPSLEIESTARILREEIIKSTVQWDDIDYMEGARYIALNWDAEKCTRSSLRRVLPVRRYNNGTRPCIRGEGPMGAESGDQGQTKKNRIKRCVVGFFFGNAPI